MKLKGYIAIYIPSKDKDGNLLYSVQRREWITKATVTMSSMFGGVTSYEVEGSWVSDEGVLMTEDVSVLKSFYSGSDETSRHIVTELALAIKKDLRQDAVTIEQNGGVDFI